MHKVCSSCKFEKNISDFYLKRNGYLGVDSKCKQCVLLSKKKLYEKRRRRRKGVIEIDDEVFHDLRLETIGIIKDYLESTCHRKSEF